MATDILKGVPIWISDHEDVIQLLSRFLDKLDNNKRPLIRLTPNSVPTLFDYNNSEHSIVWMLIQKLEQDFGIVTIEPEKANTGKEIFDNAKLRFNLEHEELVRHWLNRPKKIPYKDQWTKLMASSTWANDVDYKFIRDNPLTHADKEASLLIESLQSIDASLQLPHTVRFLSALHFWGDSKFLDKKRNYLEAAFPQRQNNILPRPILVNVYIPEQFSSVLFIENQDTFLMLSSHLLSKMTTHIALVYTAGYRGSASRIRDQACYVFGDLNQPTATSKERFTRWWVLDSLEDIPTFFWGDLDYSGLGILSSLRTKFTEMTAWEPAYRLMVEYLNEGVSHAISSGSKGSQVDPGATGCAYSDNVLLPLIRRDNQFVDQEIILLRDIEEYLIS